MEGALLRLGRLKNIVAVLLIAVVLVGTSTVALADNRTARDYMAEGIRAVYDNMHLVYQAFYDENGEFDIQPGGYVAISQEWDKDWKLLSRTYLDENCEPVQLHGLHIFWNIEFGEDGWSDWMTPRYGIENSTFTIGYADLGEKTLGDAYTCSFEIEFRNVEVTQGGEEHKFHFRSQGSTDGQWVGANVWNALLIYLDDPIENGTRKCAATVALNEIGANTKLFELGFRCDYWGSGKFRVRNVKVERGNMATDWTPEI